MEGQSSKLKETGIYDHTYLDVRKPRFSFSDIAGYDDAKEKFHDMVVIPIKHLEVLEKSGITPPSGVIVWGPLGTGKGHLIEAAASAADVNYIIIRGRECTDHPEVIRDGFRFAVENAPSVIHLMDIDWLAPRKDADYTWSDGSTKGKPDKFGSPQVHLAVHEEVAKAAPMKDVMVLASCYRIDVLDQAFTRTSMLGRKIYVPRPDAHNRKEILSHYLKGAQTEMDLEELALLTEHYIGWDIEALVRKALIGTIGKKDMLTRKTFEEVLRKVEPWLTPEMSRDYDRIYSEDCLHKYNF